MCYKLYFGKQILSCLQLDLMVSKLDQCLCTFLKMQR